MKSIPEQLQQSRDSLLECIRNGHLHIVPHGGPVIVSEYNSADTAIAQTDILTTRALKGRRHQPVKLIDVFDVAEEGADLLWFERQVSTVNNAA